MVVCGGGGEHCMSSLNSYYSRNVIKDSTINIKKKN